MIELSCSASRPRILILANRLPYPIDDGWKTRTYHVIRSLVSLGDVTLLVFHDDGSSHVDAFRRSLDGRIEVVTAPTPHAHSPLRLLLGLVSGTPVYVWNMRSRRLRQELRRLVASGSFDIVVSQLTYMYPYLREFAPDVRRVVDTHNIDSVVLRRYARSIESRLRRWYASMTSNKLQRYEARVFESADTVWVCSEGERRQVREMAPSANVHTVPNGVDTSAFVPDATVAPVPGRLVFFGKMDYFPNLDGARFFIEQVLPDIKKSVPGVELWIVGSGIGGELQTLAAQEPAVRLIGRVEDLRPVIASASAVVVPLRVGGGTRLKILEALSMGRPLVSTTIGAEGLDLRSGEDLLIADSAEDFVEAVGLLLSDRTMAERLGANGRNTVVKKYDWQQVGQTLEATLRPSSSSLLSPPAP